ncbi:MAG: alanine racemase [Pusillimonas sp.]|nr:alanine racemase [Pusillimonas sp.]MBC43246.1 alanine racemase [Pusillimonas sp.]|tara:strand:- start:32309 stop:33442 length:1134 start_codon:yes stop_codon:yes gene_type:complete
MPRPITATISLPSLRHNLGVVAHQLNSISSQNNRKRPFVWGVIKANAYGHGVANAVHAFSQADGLAMLDLDEAIQCREQGWQGPILMLEGFFHPRDIPLYAQYKLEATLHCREQLLMLEHAVPQSPLNAFIKLDTGMNRLGFEPAEFPAAWQQAQQLRQQGRLAQVGKMTHFARADEVSAYTQEQLAVYQHITQNLPGPDSVCNSAATLTPSVWQALPDENTQWVRPGICLYGSTPFTKQRADAVGLKPAMTLSSELISVRRLETGEGVGYGHIFKAAKPMMVGIVACGYADGYPRHAPTGTPVSVSGVRTRLLGRVSMDMLAVDLTDVPDPVVGSPVVLWGENGPSVDEVAQAAGTIGYELLCAVAPRVARIVVEK